MGRGGKGVGRREESEKKEGRRENKKKGRKGVREGEKQ